MPTLVHVPCLCIHRIRHYLASKERAKLVHSSLDNPHLDSQGMYAVPSVVEPLDVNAYFQVPTALAFAFSLRQRGAQFAGLPGGFNIRGTSLPGATGELLPSTRRCLRLTYVA